MKKTMAYGSLCGCSPYLVDLNKSDFLSREVNNIHQETFPIVVLEMRFEYVFANGVCLSHYQHVWDVLDDSRFWVIDKWLCYSELSNLDAATFGRELVTFMEAWRGNEQW